jgi:hypothetical protein
METLKAKVLFRRFLRGFITGFVGAVVSIGAFAGGDMSELVNWLAVLSIAGLSGGITGGFLALDKALRWKTDLT